MKTTNLILWTRLVRERDNQTCQACGSKVSVHAHHVIPKWKDPSLALETDNGKTLCHSCHWSIHRSDQWPKGNNKTGKVGISTLSLPIKTIDQIKDLAAEFGQPRSVVMVSVSRLADVKFDIPTNLLAAGNLYRKQIRLNDYTRQQIKELRKRLGLTSDAQAVILAVDRMTQQEAPQK